MDVESNRVAWERAEKLLTSIFGLIQAGIVLGLLQVAIFKLDSVFLVLLWFLGYVAAGAYVVTGSNYMLALLFKRFDWGAEKKLAKWGFVMLTSVVALSVPYLLSELTSEVVLKALK